MKTRELKEVLYVVLTFGVLMRIGLVSLIDLIEMGNM